MYIGFYKENNKAGLNFKVGNHVRISKYKNIFAKGYASNWSGKDFVIKKVQNTLPWIFFISGLNGEDIAGTFYEKKAKNKSKGV